MKIKLLLIACVILFFYGCAKEQNGVQVLKISETALTFTYDGQSRKVTINSNTTWKITGTNEWCSIDRTEGEKSNPVIITVEPNFEKEQRSVTLTVSSPDTDNATIQITQAEATEDDLYKLPVVFHILYNDPSDRNQNIEQATLNKLINDCNATYRDLSKSMDMNLKFVMATHDPQGELLPEPGIERIAWSNPITMDCEKFMDDTTNSSLMWNQNQYINIIVYTFTKTNILGIAHLPFTVSGDRLAGLSVADYYVAHPTAKNQHCVSINNKYVYDKDALNTVTHELGHYLGLFHAFSASACNDTDYCDDTPNYDRQKYEDWLASHTQQEIWATRFQRNGCDGSTFTSYNIMDYDYSYLDRFTPEQFKRVRHVLKSSPLIPGPKNARSKTRSGDMSIPKSQVII